MESILAEYSFPYGDKFKCTEGDDGPMVIDHWILKHSKPMWYFPQMLPQELGEKHTGYRPQDHRVIHAHAKLYDTMHALFFYRPGRLANATDDRLRSYLTSFGAKADVIEPLPFPPPSPSHRLRRWWFGK
eukprot:GHVU01044417.1.p2 GENE.GHVU01044417.1~~GHVU01044417.1.p2  ORF type:complete len:130 (+),score=9.44 GHVU01044417.1:374-763(+)